MYTDHDLDAAVAAGAISPEAATDLRNFIARRAAAPAADEEHFRLLTGFNDIFVAIALLLMLTAAGWLGGQVGSSGGGLFVAILSWGLAEYFTRRRRMALPSILLLLGFVGGVFLAAAGQVTSTDLLVGTNMGYPLAGCAALAAGAAWLHWRRFMVPITVAAGAGAAILTVAALLLALVPPLRLHGGMPLMLAGGLVAFALAMRWDSSDRTRMTRRSDVAFWLHLAAAPLIVHPAFSMLGVIDGGSSEEVVAIIAVAVYLILALVALAVDRRALLVSALAYVFYAISALFEAAGTPGATEALAALVIGSALLLLSAFWQRARRPVVSLLPESVQARLPPLAQPAAESDIRLRR
ncbi:hypothetical protein [Magnetospirillum molischianum]|uniref:DUF2157 domain-containing protein n=1 Tax=Magnetospirillum molischianum DSM 120 TaxID=1150626 RepID=H8FQZ7_MAGML|nr:hypothetical protein [Magnetospirillum molischianum]CCG40785.1 conserved membrane hypothetical protein [Magnetospirillum molischianum DSM 120]